MTCWKYIQVRYDPKVDEVLGARLAAAAKARRASKAEFCRAALIEAVINSEQAVAEFSRAVAEFKQARKK